MRCGPMLLCMICLLCCCSRLAAQEDVFLDPEYLLPMFVGPEAGYTLWQNQADFTISDQALPCVAFGNVDDQGPGYGIRALLFLHPRFFVSPRMRYEQRSASFITPMEDEPALDGSNSEIVLRQEAQVDLKMSSITFELRGGIDVLETGICLTAGPAINILSASYTYSERILGPQGFLYGDSRSAEHTLLSQRQFENFEDMSIDLRAGIGYLAEFGPLGIHPEISFSLPLTSSLKAPETLKQTGISGSLGILFNFGE